MTALAVVAAAVAMVASGRLRVLPVPMEMTATTAQETMVAPADDQFTLTEQGEVVRKFIRAEVWGSTARLALTCARPTGRTGSPLRDRFRSGVCVLLAMGGLTMAAATSASAEPFASGPGERQYLTEVDQYLLRPRPTDDVLLKAGHQACQVRRSGGSSDKAKGAIWDTLEYGSSRRFAGAEVGSIVHVAVDNLCPEVGYP